jgi:type I restriction enzyme R subunit
MVMFTRKIHRRLGGNFTFLVLTDREDLDTQIYKTFAGCGVVNHDREPCRASDGKHLGRLLGQHKSFIFSLIQKFNREVDPDEGYTQRDDIIVITDEAHRTQYGILALNMRNALPNASYIGFTGTPLFTDDEITRQVFGEYVSTYDFQRAVEDKATVPLYYDARGDKLGIAMGTSTNALPRSWRNWKPSTSTFSSDWSGSSNATTTSSPQASGWTRWPVILCSITPRPGKPARPCWSVSTR